MTFFQLSSLQGYHRTYRLLRSDVFVCYFAFVFTVFLHLCVCLPSSSLPHPALYFRIPLDCIFLSHSTLSFLFLSSAVLSFPSYLSSSSHFLFNILSEPRSPTLPFCLILILSTLLFTLLSTFLSTALPLQSLETEESELMGCLSYHLGTPVEAGDVARSLMKVLLRLAGHLYVDKYVWTTTFIINLPSYCSVDGRMSRRTLHHACDIHISVNSECVCLCVRMSQKFFQPRI